MNNQNPELRNHFGVRSKEFILHPGGKNIHMYIYIQLLKCLFKKMNGKSKTYSKINYQLVYFRGRAAMIYTSWESVFISLPSQLKKLYVFVSWYKNLLICSFFQIRKLMRTVFLFSSMVIQPKSMEKTWPFWDLPTLISPNQPSKAIGY